MDKDFKEEHTKTMNKLKKIQEHENVVLPPIKNSHDNPTMLETKKYYNTESGLKSGKDNESNSRNKSEDEDDESNSRSFYNTGKGSGAGSGTNSVDK